MQKSTNVQGTNPIVSGQTYVYHNGSQRIVGEIVDCSSRQDVYLKCSRMTSDGVMYTHNIVPRLLVMPLYQFN